MSDPLLMERTGPAWTLTLNRPDKRNALNHDMWRSIPGLLAEASEARDAKALIITGAGGAFAAGADISEFETVYATPESAAAYSSAIATALDRLAAFPKPTLAKIRGACVGGGCGIALACDIRFAARGARFGITPGKLGLVYTLSDTNRLVEAVGVSTAKDILFSGRLLDGEEALRTGLINQLTEPDDLEGAVGRICRTLGRHLLRFSADDQTHHPAHPTRRHIRQCRDPSLVLGVLQQRRFRGGLSRVSRKAATQISVFVKPSRARRVTPARPPGRPTPPRAQ